MTIRNSGEDCGGRRLRDSGIRSRPNPSVVRTTTFDRSGPALKPILSTPVWIGLIQLFVTSHHVHTSLILGSSLAWSNVPRANPIIPRGHFPAILDEHFRTRESPIQRERE